MCQLAPLGPSVLSTGYSTLLCTNIFTTTDLPPIISNIDTSPLCHRAHPQEKLTPDFLNKPETTLTTNTPPEEALQPHSTDP
eukprot:13500920-Ditylum_brightwellii.AAC.1